MDQTKFLIIGANGQLGQALQAQYPKAAQADVDTLDITSRDSVQNYDWSRVTTVLNAAAYTNVDGAETGEGRVAAWKVNAHAAMYLSEVAAQHDITLIHISSDYVFDGTNDLHTETETFSPLSVYGASKAAGDVAVSLVPKHYILRTSWVIGEGKNFVRVMLKLGKDGVNPTVVSDQVGRLTFTAELVRAIDHLLSKQPAFGTYNVSNEGTPMSWADITRQIFSAAGYSNTVSDTTTEKYYEGKENIALRPLKSTLALDKIKAIGFIFTDWQDDLKQYIVKELGQ